MPDPYDLLIYNGRIVTADGIIENGFVGCRGDRIAEVSGNSLGVPANGRTAIDAGGDFVVPGFIDIHVHGGAGADYMDGTSDAVICANQAHARHGTTTIFPTTTTGSPEQIRAMLRATGGVKADWRPEDGSRIGGVHFYGPYFAADKVGCHSPSGRRDPNPTEYLEALDSGLVRVATCAAELPGAQEFFRAAAERGCLVTCGHSNSSWREMAAAFESGMRHVDHFWCAMSSVPSMRARFGSPTQGSMEQFVLMHREMSTEVIADGCHLAPELLEFAYRMKGADRLCLVTDANRALDMPPGKYRFGPETDGDWFESDGRVGFQEGGRLASAVVGMDAMVRQMIEVTSAGIVNSVRMGSLTPAERVGIDNETGSIAVGKLADILIMSPKFYVRRTFIGGAEHQS